MFAGAARSTTVLAQHPWLAVCERIAERRASSTGSSTSPRSSPSAAASTCRSGTRRGCGRDWDVEALLAEGDPWWQLDGEATAGARSPRTAATDDCLPGIGELVVDGTPEMVVMLGRARSVRRDLPAPRRASARPLPLLHGADVGASVADRALSDYPPGVPLHRREGWVAPGGDLSPAAPALAVHQRADALRDPATRSVRRARLRRAARASPISYMATSLYHPDTVVRSFEHDGSGPNRASRTPRATGTCVPTEVACSRLTSRCCRPGMSCSSGRQCPSCRPGWSTPSTVAARRSRQARPAPYRQLGSSSPRLERDDRPQEGILRIEWGAPTSWHDVILQGPHFHVAMPFYKAPNPTMMHNQDWSAVDLEDLTARRDPGDVLQARGDGDLRPRYTHWGGQAIARARSLPRRVAAHGSKHRREDADPGSDSAGRGHIDGVSSAGAPGRHPRRCARQGLAQPRLSATSCPFRPEERHLVATFERFLADAAHRSSADSLLRTCGSTA